MAVEYEIVVEGCNLGLREGTLGMSTVVLVKAPEGPILFDTGHRGSFPVLIRGLREQGLEPGDVKTVFLSHLHYDHVGNIDLFPEARVLVSRSEWEYAETPHANDYFMPWLVHEQLRRHRLELIEGEGRLCDGVTYRPAPGHTPGSYVLELDTADEGRVVLAGDAVKYIKEVLLGHGDMTFDTQASSAATIGTIVATADRIVPGHFQELRKTETGFVWDRGVEVPLMLR